MSVNKEIIGKVIDRAWDLWSQDITEESHVVFEGPIFDLYQKKDALGWSWVTDYDPKRNQWCGATVSYFWGEHVKLKLRKYLFSSCFRLTGGHDARHKDDKDLYQWGHRRRVIDLNDIQEGDIVLVGSGKHGSHITMVVSLEDGDLITMEGNSRKSIGPGGKVREGLGWVRRSRSEAKFVIRVEEEDLI